MNQFNQTFEQKLTFSTVVMNSTEQGGKQIVFATFVENGCLFSKLRVYFNTYHRDLKPELLIETDSVDLALATYNNLYSLGSTDHALQLIEGAIS